MYFLKIINNCTCLKIINVLVKKLLTNVLYEINKCTF